MISHRFLSIVEGILAPTYRVTSQKHRETHAGGRSTVTEETLVWGACSWSWEELAAVKVPTHNGSPRSWVGITSSLWPPQRQGMRTWRNALPGINRNAPHPGGR